MVEQRALVAFPFPPCPPFFFFRDHPLISFSVCQSIPFFFSRAENDPRAGAPLF